MARYIDNYNAADIFVISFCNPISPNADSQKVMIAKKVAEKEELMDKGLLKDKEIYSIIKELYDSHKRLVSRNLELDYLKKYDEVTPNPFWSELLLVQNFCSGSQTVFKSDRHSK